MIILVALFLAFQGVVIAQEEVEPEVTQEEINQNIKDRLKKVAEEQDSLVGVKRKQAMVGELESLANDTLTIKTKTEIKLASISGQTEYVRNPGSKSVEVEDVAIGDFVIAMGYVNGSEVLEARRVLLYSSAPEEVGKSSAFGNISNIDDENETFTFTTPIGDEINLEISKNSSLFVSNEVFLL